MPNRYELLSSEPDERSWSSSSSSTDSSSVWSSSTNSPSSSSPPLKKKGKRNKQPHIRSEENQWDSEQKLLNRLYKLKWLTVDGKPVDYDVLKKYLKQVEQSEGFDITDFPGVIADVTSFMPVWAHMDKREKCPLLYDGLMNLAALATRHYNKKHRSEFKVVEIQRATGLGDCGVTYYITFSAVDVSHRNSGNGSLLTSLYNQFANTMRHVFQLIRLKWLIWFTEETIEDEETMQLDGCFLYCLETPMQKLKDQLLKLQCAPECRAGMDDLLDETLPRMIFRGVVKDGEKPEVLSCSRVC